MTGTAIACPSCGAAPSRAAARYCDACGSSLRRPASSAEFKQATVLFADVVESMKVATIVGPERLREIMGELVGRGVAVIQRFGGTMDKFTGDGLMAVFGAPQALEDHAMRACLAALGIQAEARRFAADVGKRDGIELRLRIGLNSGQVVAGEIGSGIPGYTAVGEQVGLAQRMESVAPPGGVMLSESSARLVEHAAELDETQLVHIKGATQPIAARRLRAIRSHHGLVGGVEPRLVGRQSEIAALETMLDRSLTGRGVVVGLAGPPGVGKSRLSREAAALAAVRGVDVIWCSCESHAGNVPFHLATRLLRAMTGIGDREGPWARARVRARFSDADPVDLLMFDDLLGIADPDVALPTIAPDARRQRLLALINAAPIAEPRPVLYIVEDAHWIDEVSEAMLADFLTGIPHSYSMAMVTYRPEYHGILRQLPETQAMTLAPLSEAQTLTLLDDVLGTDPSVRDLAAAVRRRAAGNPFFAEEMVRDLVQRGVLEGDRGRYLCHADTADVPVPVTVQAAIEARIDRLDVRGKRTLNAASVVGTRFDAELLAAIGTEPVFDELLRAELIDQNSDIAGIAYTFRHPLIRTVAYESQLQSDRAEVHRRLAAAIQTRAESRGPDLADPDAALIAEHLEAAGDLHAAFDWHMRAGAWSTNRDIAAARMSWKRARLIADALPAGDSARPAMRIAARSMLCVSSWRASGPDADSDLDELRKLCDETGDKASLTLALSAQLTAVFWPGDAKRASQLASEQMALLDSIGDPALTVGMAYPPMSVKAVTGEYHDLLNWSQMVIDLAADDATMGSNFGMGSPLAAACSFRGHARYALGLPGWRQDLDGAAALARSTDPVTHALVAASAYGPAVSMRVLRAEPAMTREIEDAIQVAEKTIDDTALGSAKCFLGLALVAADDPADRVRGSDILVQIRDSWVREKTRLFLVPVADTAIAYEMARRGDHEGAVPMLRASVEELIRSGQTATGMMTLVNLAETLLERCAEGDVAEAEAVIDRVESLAGPAAWAVRDIWAIRLRGLLARAVGDDVAYRTLVSRYRSMAVSLGFEGHIAMADAADTAAARQA
ncbi:ATP-binding protein [Mycolicibacterium neworleansense]|uniref:Membrane-anchored adenylyl cyclase n=1 Tax=Mycolicibacterium neworleansense TaxID=146018 RepID=A0A0H5RRV0_9MYCO|nr:adenylate/guanylate cyclase domain-containing protein [Mycolicibacterium neworleansense]MCV7365842.1 AAA family ATPase [Mycolicibacterium neworleansense]CRZ16541.1 membrane-anchored adenylyl cyclase [Mycolicibacterium neworleansense]